MVEKDGKGESLIKQPMGTKFGNVQKNFEHPMAEISNLTTLTPTSEILCVREGERGRFVGEESKRKKW